jgi:translation initiation factor IF-1
MVKNVKGGNKSKKMGRKFLSAPVDKNVRLSIEEGEIYAVVTKNLGNGMFYANDPEGKELLCIMRNKFKGRGKRDNKVELGAWVLVGKREFECCAKPKHDLLEVYTDIEKNKLKDSGNPIFAGLKSNFDNDDDYQEQCEVSFEYDDSDKYKNLIEQVNENTNNESNVNTIKTIIDDDGDEVDFDDI